ncbi:TrkA family potassium uptake protein [candidate division KSB1 bacterium]|nr:TrkA family potassium uptake protein [candidate division KSB1 bacterium]
MFNKQNPLFIVIIGCGRVGSYLANKLSLEGHSIVIIDPQESAFLALSAEFSGFKIEGDATEFEILKKSKIQKADFLLAVSGDDNTNLMVAQIAKSLFNVPKVIARIFEQEKKAVFQESGIEIICPISIVGDVFFDAIFSARRAEA